ncbi:MAG: ribose 5-phosphate isomerase B [Oligoflexia bacterium]|nr:ribose 5-phosphate isomerase B [Oligoflexia bacterium]
MKIFLASDHAGPSLKKDLIDYLNSDIEFRGAEVIDLGTHDADQSVNYPDFAIKLCKELLEANKLIDTTDIVSNFGILICGSGIGVCMVANRFNGIRAALCRSEEDARLSKEHNNANVICLGARMTSCEDAKKIILAWKKAEFQKGRHSKRLEIFDNLS